MVFATPLVPSILTPVLKVYQLARSRVKIWVVRKREAPGGQHELSSWDFIFLRFVRQAAKRVGRCCWRVGGGKGEFSSCSSPGMFQPRTAIPLIR